MPIPRYESYQGFVTISMDTTTIIETFPNNLRIQKAQKKAWKPSGLGDLKALIDIFNGIPNFLTSNKSHKIVILLLSPHWI